MNDFTRLSLTQAQKATRNWPIGHDISLKKLHFLLTIKFAMMICRANFIPLCYYNFFVVFNLQIS